MIRTFPYRFQLIIGLIFFTAGLACSQSESAPSQTVAPSSPGDPSPPTVAPVDPHAAYYANIDSSNRIALRQSLHQLIDDHARQTYAMVWTVLERADENPDNPTHILDLYRNESFAKGSSGNRPYDREHSWPKSYGFPNDSSSNAPYTDCHHLFLCFKNYNSSRGNKPYDNCPGCEERPTLANGGAGGGSGTYPGNSNWTAGSGSSGRWETWKDRRGDVARAQFYMDIRYEGGTHGATGAMEPDLVLTNDVSQMRTGTLDVAYMGRLDTLIRWHSEDPVDERERHRNDIIYEYQGNRNPFIDHPEWVNCAFRGFCD